MMMSPSRSHTESGNEGGKKQKQRTDEMYKISHINKRDCKGTT